MACTPRTLWCVAFRRMSPCPTSHSSLIGLIRSSLTGAASRMASAAWPMCRSCHKVTVKSTSKTPSRRGRCLHPVSFGGWEFTSFFSVWSMLAHHGIAKRTISGGRGTPGALAEIGMRRAFVCPLVGRSRGSLWSCSRGSLCPSPQRCPQSRQVGAPDNLRPNMVSTTTAGRLLWSTFFQWSQ